MTAKTSRSKRVAKRPCAAHAASKTTAAMGTPVSTWVVPGSWPATDVHPAAQPARSAEAPTVLPHALQARTRTELMKAFPPASPRVAATASRTRAKNNQAAVLRSRGFFCSIAQSLSKRYMKLNKANMRTTLSTKMLTMRTITSVSRRRAKAVGGATGTAKSPNSSIATANWTRLRMAL